MWRWFSAILASVEWPVSYGNFFNEYSFDRGKVGFSLPGSSRWRKLFDIPTSLYGGVSGYLNLARRGDSPPRLAKTSEESRDRPVKLHSLEGLF